MSSQSAFCRQKIFIRSRSATRSTILRTMATSSHQSPSSQLPATGQQNKRPTHFVCFPLVTDASVSQLSESLAYFRSITTPLPSEEDTSTRERKKTGSEAESQSLGPDERHTINSTDAAQPFSSEGQNQKLRLIPEAAHRPPGTFHLTLGTMDLSTEVDMGRAVKLLQEIDYLELLREAEEATERGKSVDTDWKQTGRNPRRGIDARSATFGQEADESQSEARVAREKGDEDGEKKVEIESLSAADSIGNDQTKGEGTHMLSNTAETPPPSPPISLTRAISPPSFATKPSTECSTSPSTIPRARHKTPSSQTHTSSSAASSVPLPLTISLHSLGTFPRPSSSRVFYAHPHDPTSRLQRFGVLVRKQFQSAGLITETRPLVLHATVANLIYVKGKGRGGGRWRGRGGRGGKGRDEGEGGNVDARNILRFFNDGPTTMATTTSTASLSASTIRRPAQYGPGPQPDREVPLAQPPPSASTSASTPPSASASSSAFPITWATSIPVDRIRICKMGAEKSDLEGWGLEYRPIAEKIFPL